MRRGFPIPRAGRVPDTSSAAPEAAPHAPAQGADHHAPGRRYPVSMEPLPDLCWTEGCQGTVRYGTVNGTAIVVVGSNGNPKGKYSIRWVAPKQEQQPFMFRSRLEDAIALAERVLRLKGQIA